MVTKAIHSVLGREDQRLPIPVTAATQWGQEGLGKRPPALGRTACAVSTQCTGSTQEAAYPPTHALLRHSPNITTSTAIRQCCWAVRGNSKWPVAVSSCAVAAAAAVYLSYKPSAHLHSTAKLSPKLAKTPRCGCTRPTVVVAPEAPVTRPLVSAGEHSRYPCSTCDPRHTEASRSSFACTSCNCSQEAVAALNEGAPAEMLGSRHVLPGPAAITVHSHLMSDMTRSIASRLPLTYAFTHCFAVYWSPARDANPAHE